MNDSGSRPLSPVDLLPLPESLGRLVLLMLTAAVGVSLIVLLSLGLFVVMAGEGASLEFLSRLVDAMRIQG
jgi:hypothetical protein